MSGTKTNSGGAVNFTFNGTAATIAKDYYFGGERYYDLVFADGSIRRMIPQDNSAANPPKTNGEKDGKHSII